MALDGFQNAAWKMPMCQAGESILKCKEGSAQPRPLARLLRV